ncbi:MAG: arylsulfatase [Acidobacteria bacterium]|nr:arylsulfatase [Acidobacteriota bacterium]
MRDVTRRNVLTSLGAMAAAPAAPIRDRRPNIVLILADDLGMGDLGCYGQKLLRTPNIDRLASEGTLFTDAYAGAMVCAPSRCTLMTGYHLGHATVRDNWEAYPEGQYPLAERDVTVAATLKKAGYSTGICGKWGLGGPDSRSAPNKAGFDFFYGYNCQRHAHRFYTDYLWRNTERIPIAQSAAKRVYAQDLIADASLQFIRENRNNPFFLFCAWTLPHGPHALYNVPNVDAYRNTGWSDAEKVWATMVDRLDADVGRVTRQIQDLGLERDTLLLFASDNGAGGSAAINKRFGSQAGLRDVKGTLREGGIRVPMIARWPGKVPAGRTSDFANAFWDFLPTAAELAGASAPKGIDGISIVPTLLGRQQKPHDYLYWERRAGGPAGNRLTRAVRTGNWKGYRESDGAPMELYDLHADRAETNDLAAAHPDIVERMARMMQAAHVDVTPPPPDPRIWELYRENNKRLDEMLAK